MFLFRRLTPEEKMEREKKKNKKLLEKEKRKRERKQRKKQMYEDFLQQYKVVGEGAGAIIGVTPSKTVVINKSGIEKGRLLWVVSSLSELPQDVQDSIGRMKVPTELLNKNLPTLMNVLSFTDKLRPKRLFRTREQQELIDSHPLARNERERCNIHPPHFLLSPENSFQKLTIREAKRMFKIGNLLGRGGFGAVYQAKASKEANLPSGVKSCAIKIVPHNTDKQISYNVMEASFLSHIDCSNICKLYKTYLVEDEEVWFIMELMEGGTLQEAAKARENGSLRSHTNRHEQIGEPHLAFIAREILIALSYLHSLNLAHRDLKSSNVMLTTEGRIKLIDLGLCADLSRGPRMQMVGSPFWMAPEMIRGEPHSFSVDIWSLAICLLELANHCPPYVKNVRRAMFNIAVQGILMAELAKDGVAPVVKQTEEIKVFDSPAACPEVEGLSSDSTDEVLVSTNLHDLSTSTTISTTSTTSTTTTTTTATMASTTSNIAKDDGESPNSAGLSLHLDQSLNINNSPSVSRRHSTTPSALSSSGNGLVKKSSGSSARGPRKTYGLLQPSKWSAEFKDFLENCEQLDQTKRTTAKDLLKHSFLQKAVNEEEMQKIITDIFVNQAVFRIME